MKLIIQIPCFNEEETLPIALKELPREVEGFDQVEWLIINDGSTDKTVDVARKYGVDHVVDFSQNKGLARGFIAGLERCLQEGADVIVNTDADNQYNAQDIPNLVEPILRKQADIVIGTRPIGTIGHFSPAKKCLQKIGSYVVRLLSGTEVEDAPSGFRAISRDAAFKLNVFNTYTYTLETIIQAGAKDMSITTVPVRTNGELRPSRLFKSIPAYIRKSVITLIRIFAVYRPFRFFVGIGSIIFLLGTLIGLRFLVIYFTGDGTGHIQSLILASVLLGMGFQCIMVGFLADLLAVNRSLLEDTQFRLKDLQINGGLGEKPTTTAEPRKQQAPIP